ncbi:DEKNAAC102371 [Brettanomyces naardenensis]|uniref:biotin synthase n=1 Tax=Brettanomyces naardenensis TaxID=13370 RepID=A0A448YLB4_BRENA|nr:DEKNAAC102371 [Brettanomyces naardenensis]
MFRVTCKRYFSTSATIRLAQQSATDTFSNGSPLNLALTTEVPIHNWTKDQIHEIYNTPLNSLIFYAQLIHRKYHNPSEIQLCTLLSIKTGGCTEDCKYCAQSSRNNTGVKAEKLLDVDSVFAKAKEAKERGSTRFCMGSAWRDMHGRKSAMKKIGTMVKRINDELQMETCVTLGMLDEGQAQTLKSAGLTAYNHNIDTSREHYKDIISTRTFDDRLETIKRVQDANIGACTGGILGLGETDEDHVSFLYTLANMDKHPESLPINRLIPIKGTPMAEELRSKYKGRQLTLESILRTIATARLLMPESIVRLAAGRYTMKESEQLLCFMSGVNAIFTGEKMLTTMCTGWDEDIAMLKKWGFIPMKAFKKTGPKSHLQIKIDPAKKTFTVDLTEEENSERFSQLKALN